MPSVYRSKIKVAGNWYGITATYVKVDGVWKLATAVQTKVNGTWKSAYPYPLSSDSTLSSFTVNGSSVLSSGAITVAYGTSSVTVGATPNSPLASVSGTGSRSLTSNPTTLSVVVTAEDGGTRTYSVSVTIAAPPPPSTVYIYWAYCSGYNPPVTGSGTVSGTSDASVACNQQKSALGNPSNWVCGGSPVTAPNCGEPPPPPPPPCQPTCEFSYKTCSVSFRQDCYGCAPYYVCDCTYYYTDTSCGYSCSSTTSTFTNTSGIC